MQRRSYIAAPYAQPAPAAKARPRWGFILIVLFGVALFAASKLSPAAGEGERIGGASADCLSQNPEHLSTQCRAELTAALSN